MRAGLHVKELIDRRAVLAAMAGAGALAATSARAAPLPDWITGHGQAATPPPVDYLAVARQQLARQGNRIAQADRVGIVDFGLPSYRPRFALVDLIAGKVDMYPVTHGRGSDPQHDGWLKRYSNIEGSEATSRGAYLTRSWYKGRYGTSLRLDGLDPTNSNALPRAIVMHQADYATPEHVERWGRLGRSNGCLAMGPEPRGPIRAFTERPPRNSRPKKAGRP